MTIQRIQSEDCSVASLFQSFYAVPDYQREYVWDTDQVEQLLKDVREEMGDGAAHDAPEYFIGSMTLLHKSSDGRGSPFPGGSSYGFRDWDCERGEAVQDGVANLELGDLTMEVACGQPLAQQFHAVHLCLGPASAAISAPSSPDGSTDTLRCVQDFVSRDHPAVSGFHGLAFLRGGMIAAAPRAAMASWHLRVSKAQSAVTLPISCSGGI